MDTIGLHLGVPTLVTLKAGASVMLEALDHVPVGADAGIDFGLYATADTKTTENGVAMEAADFTAPRVFTMGAPSAVAHLFTRESSVIVTAGSQDIDGFHAVLKAVPRFFARSTHGQAVTPVAA